MHVPVMRAVCKLSPALCVGRRLQGSIESLLCARVSDSMIGDKHNSNTELIAQVRRPHWHLRQHLSAPFSWTMPPP